MRRLDADEVARRRRGRNIAVGLILLGLFVLFYLITIVKIKGTLP